MRGEIQASSDKLAVLIDADNAKAELVEPLFKEIAKYGTSYVKRIYGDWTNPYLSKWKQKLNKFSIQPIQQFRYTTGKNATDGALIIDAMDLLYTQKFDGFCIVSSDSDFTRLASRIRESGLVVYGFGEKSKTPKAFINACNKFVYTDILNQSESSTEIASSQPSLVAVRNSSEAVAKESQHVSNNKKLIHLLGNAYDAIAEKEEWVHLGPFGSQLTKLSPSFDPKNYGYKKLSDLVQFAGLFEINKASKHIRIKLKA
jgi:uncharacterized LabA/DUF88 family protein